MDGGIGGEIGFLGSEVTEVRLRHEAGAMQDVTGGGTGEEQQKGNSRRATAGATSQQANNQAYIHSQMEDVETRGQQIHRSVHARMGVWRYGGDCLRLLAWLYLPEDIHG